MQLSDSHWVPTSPAQTWEALHDPDTLRRCLGSRQVTRVRPQEYAVELDARLAGATHHFKGRLLVTEEEAPNRADLAFEGLEEHAGMALGHVQIQLEPAQQGGTRIRYTVHGAASGELCEIGARAAQQAVQRMIDDFFTRFVDDMTRAPSLQPALAGGQAEGHSLQGSTALSWIGLLAVVTVVVLYYAFLR
ncbi:hypothetical protein FOZ76_25495 [Verticiella sediminum]|uniref:Carbon monoxide dehydrogenase subunit G n=1 Tax=Verticiella sediminum TaxID=1247510 RepID=A0A556A7W6_9BURK|nr:SRPBCC domain-containing protein [Verticiella sediminum]TSH88981.1 hypothetical protein FOZ76_25495 [Verticiella sediminum]